MRRILLVLGPSSGGIGRHVAGLAHAVRASGDEVWVGGPAETLKRFGLAGDQVGHVDMSARGGLGRLRQVAQESDLIHAHGLRAGVWSGLATPWKKPLIVTWHNVRMGPRSAKRGSTMIERYVARRADLAFCVSQDLVDTVTGHGGKAELRPVGPPVLPPPSRSAIATRELLAIPREAAMVLALARLHPQKGLDVLIDAVAIMPSPAVLVVAGMGPLEDELRARADAADVDVRWLGRRSDVANLLVASDVVAMPSRWEGSPLALHEAFQARRPAIATAVGGVPRLAGDGALLIPVGDPAALRDAIVQVLGDPELAARLVEGGERALLTWPDEATACEVVMNRYDDLLARG